MPHDLQASLDTIYLDRHQPITEQANFDAFPACKTGGGIHDRSLRGSAIVPADDTAARTVANPFQSTEEDTVPELISILNAYVDSFAIFLRFCSANPDQQLFLFDMSQPNNFVQVADLESATPNHDPNLAMLNVLFIALPIVPTRTRCVTFQLNPNRIDLRSGKGSVAKSDGNVALSGHGHFGPGMSASAMTCS
jgi:hypothetical protein